MFLIHPLHKNVGYVPRDLCNPTFPTFRPAMATSSQRIGYLSLPAEIRIQIMEYILMPGHIKYRKPSSPVAFKEARDSKSSWETLATVLRVLLKPRTDLLCSIVKGTIVGLVAPFFQAEAKSKPRFNHCPQLLATCRQVYNEGRHMFYEINVFHLPPGGLEDTIEWYHNLQPDNRALIKHVQIIMSTVDLTPFVLQGFKAWELTQRVLHYKYFTPHQRIAEYLYLNVWKRKIEFLRAWKRLQPLCVSFSISMLGWLPLNGEILCRSTDDDAYVPLSRIFTAAKCLATISMEDAGRTIR